MKLIGCHIALFFLIAAQSLAQSNSINGSVDYYLEVISKSQDSPESILVLLQNAYEQAIGEGPEREFEVLIQKSIFLNDISRFDEAGVTAQLALELAIDLDDGLKEGMALYHLADSFYRLENSEKSFEIVQSALRIFRTIKNKYWEGKTLSLLGGVLMLNNENEKALKAIETSYKILDSINSPEKITPLFNLSYYYLINNEAERSIPYAEQGLAYYQKENDPQGIAISHGNLGYAYGLLGNLKKARYHYEICLNTARKYQYWEIIYKSYKDISETSESAGLHQDALKYYKKYVSLKDSVATLNVKTRIANLEVQYEAIKKDQELKDRETKIMQLSIQEKVNKQQQLLLLVCIISLLIIGVLYFFKFKDDEKKKNWVMQLEKELMERKLELEKKEKQNMQAQLSYKSRQLTNFALDISQKNKFTEDLLDSLSKLKNSSPTALDAKVKDLEMFVVNNLQINEGMRAFKENIGDVNLLFYQKLENQFPKLSKGDLELCGLIRLNLQNKEIASMRRVSESAIKMARYRLRKKIGILPEDDLVKFLRNIG